MEQLGSHHLRELCRLGSESLGHRPFLGRFLKPGKIAQVGLELDEILDSISA